MARYFICPDCGTATPADLQGWYEFHTQEIWHETCNGCGATYLLQIQGTRTDNTP